MRKRRRASILARPEPEHALRSVRPMRTPGAFVVVAPALLSAVLSLIAISGRSLGFDEGATATIAAQHGSTLWSAIAHDGGNMSGYYLLVHLLTAVFGNGKLVLRLPSTIAIVATTAIIAAIGRRLFDLRVALIAGLLTAVSLPLIFWAQSARGYAPMVAFVCGAFLIFVTVATQETMFSSPAMAPRVGLWVGFVALMTLATYSSLVAVLVVPVQLLALAPKRRRAALGPYVTSMLAYVLLCVPLLVVAFNRGSGQLFWVQPPNHQVDVQVLQSLTSAGLQPSFHRTATTTVLLILTVLALLAIIGWQLHSAWRTDGDWGFGVVLGWAVLPALLTFFYSLVAQPLFVPRNLLMSTPAVGLALAAALGHPRAPRLAGLGAVIVLLALRGLQVGAAYGVSPEPWQQVTAYVHEHARPGDCIAFYPMDSRMVFQYYVGSSATATRTAPRSILPIVRWGSVKPYVERYGTLSRAQIVRRAAGCRRMWFVSSHEGQADGPAASLVNRARWLTLRARLESVFGRAPVRQFGYAAVIHVQLMAARHPPRRRVRGAASGRRS